jgi:uncharacterized membrane protein
MEKFKAFLKRKDIEISIKRYGIDALGAMAQGLFCSLLIGTIINTLGTQFHISFLTTAVATVNDTQYTVGSLASAMSGPAMAVAIGYALHCPPLVLFSLITVGFASNALGGAGGPLAVLFVAIFASEIGKAVSKETKIDILVTPLVTIGVGVALSAWWAPALGSAAMKVGNIIMWATNLQPFLMGILVSVFVGIALTLPISSAAICAALGLTGLAGGAAVAGCCAQMVGFVLPRKQMGWSCFSGNRNIHAPDGKYRKKSTHLDCTDPYFCHHRTSCNLSVQTSDERYSGFFRYGYLWFRRTDWCLHRMDE